MIEYRGKPLFGEGSSISHTSEFFAIAGTLLFWLLFLIFSFVIKPQPKKPEYKEVQIVLESTPVVQKVEEAPAPAEAASASASEASKSAVSESAESVETPVREVVEVQPVVDTAPTKKTEPVKQKESSKPAAKKVETQKNTQNNIQYSKTVEELMNEQFGQKTNTSSSSKQNSNEIWEMLEQEETQENQSNNVSAVIGNTGNDFFGVAGKQSDDSSQTMISTNSDSYKENDEASDNTKDFLVKIKNAKYISKSSNGISSETNANVATDSSGKVLFSMSNNRMRKLLDPDEPKIILSPESIATINISTPTVTIRFKVGTSGGVYGVEITPSSILNGIVKNDIEQQLRTWRFESADYTATASFEYRIVKQ